MEKNVIILGTAHLATTPGKCSPDGRLRECVYSRDIVTRVKTELEQRGHTVFVDYEPLEPSAQMRSTSWRVERDRELRWRVASVNNLCRQYTPLRCLYVSIHVNAAGGDGLWHKARGFSVMVSPRGSYLSKQLAQSLYFEAEQRKLQGNRCVPPSRFWTQSLHVLNKTACPAVLTENLFQDNREDVDFLLSAEGKAAITALHVEGICKYIQSL